MTRSRREIYLLSLLDQHGIWYPQETAVTGEEQVAIIERWGTYYASLASTEELTHVALTHDIDEAELITLYGQLGVEASARLAAL